LNCVLNLRSSAEQDQSEENPEDRIVDEASGLMRGRDFVRVRLPRANLDPVDAADLHQAIMQRDFGRIWWLVEQREVDVNQLDDHVLGYYTTALHIACEIGDPIMVNRFLEKGSRADIPDEFGRYPIVSALIGKEGYLTKMSIIEALLKTGVGVKQRNPINGKTPIHYAVVGPNDLIVYLKDKGADISAKDNAGRTPLHDALDIQDPNDPAWRNVEYLLGLGAKPNAVDREGRTPLHIAAERHEYVRCKELLRWNARVNARDRSGRTPMRYVRPQPYGEDSIISLFQRFGGRL
jgi:ankyrin repeat protein